MKSRIQVQGRIQPPFGPAGNFPDEVTVGWEMLCMHERVGICAGDGNYIPALVADRFILLLILRSRDRPRWYPHSLWIKVKNAFRDTLRRTFYWKQSAKGTDQQLSSFTDGYQMLCARHCSRCWRSEVNSNNGDSSSMCLYSAYDMQAVLLQPTHDIGCELDWLLRRHYLKWYNDAY